MGNEAMRRRLFVLGGLSLAGSALTQQSVANQSAMNDLERANVKLVMDFLAGWNSKDLNIDRHVHQYIAPNASVRWFDDEPAVSGPTAAAEAAKRDVPKGLRVSIKVLDVFAFGPLVATSRVDTIIRPGRQDEVMRIAGVHIVKELKIQEYVDYIVTV